MTQERPPQPEKQMQKKKKRAEEKKSVEVNGIKMLVYRSTSRAIFHRFVFHNLHAKNRQEVHPNLTIGV